MIHGIIFDRTVRVCIDTRESESSRPDIIQFIFSELIDFDFNEDSFSFDRASTLRTQSPMLRSSFVFSVCFTRGFARTLEDLVEISGFFVSLNTGDSGSGFARLSFKET